MAVLLNAQHSLPLQLVLPQSSFCRQCGQCGFEIASNPTVSDVVGDVLALKRIQGTDRFEVITGCDNITAEPEDQERPVSSKKRKRDGSLSPTASGEVLLSSVALPDDEGVATKRRRSADEGRDADREQNNPPSTPTAGSGRPANVQPCTTRYSRLYVPCSRIPIHESNPSEQETEERKWLMTMSPPTPLPTRERMEACASQMAGPPVLFYWRSVLQAWRRTYFDLTAIVSPLAVTSRPWLQPQGEDAKFFCLWDCACQAQRGEFLYRVFHRLCTLKIYDRYQMLRDTNAPCDGRRRAGLAKQEVFRWLYGTKLSEPERKREWKNFGNICARAKRWSLMRDEFGLGIVGLVPGAASKWFVEQGVDEPQYRKWLQYVRIFHPDVVELATRLTPLLQMAFKGEKNSLPPSRLELWEGDTVELHRFGAHWLEPTAAKASTSTVPAPFNGVPASGASDALDQSGAPASLLRGSLFDPNRFRTYPPPPEEDGTVGAEGERNESTEP